MADSKTSRADTSQQGAQTLARKDQETGRLQRSSQYGGTFDLFDRMAEEMDRTFDRIWGGFGLPRRSVMGRGTSWMSRDQGLWAPRVEAFQKGDHFIVRAELPGVNRDDVQVELTDEALTIHGERKHEHEEEREGYFHSEREYGEFRRTVPLPDGVIGESAQASFRDGVLEVRMQAAPAEARRGRRLEIRDASQGEEQK